MLHQIPIRSERRRLDLHGVSVEPVAKVLLDGDSVLVDIGPMASRHTRRIAGGSHIRLSVVAAQVSRHGRRTMDAGGQVTRDALGASEQAEPPRFRWHAT